MSLVLLPAIDIANGQAVSLYQARPGTEASYGSPLDIARGWQSSGARWVHFVDVDAALGRGSNTTLLTEITNRLEVRAELSGGVCDDTSLEATLATRCARVSLSTAALNDFDWCVRAICDHGERVAVELDVRIIDGHHRLHARGHNADSGDLWRMMDRLNSVGCARYIVTDVTRDGTMSGPNLELLRRVCAATDVPIVASGGVATLDDLRAIAELAPCGIEGVITGKALHTGQFTFREACAAVE